MLFYVRVVACVILRVQMLLEPISSRCNLHGAFDPCGTCKCEPEYYGDYCECSVGYRIPDQETALAACTQSGSTVPCNGKGECKCGYCECFTVGSNVTNKYYGRFCECDDFSCPIQDDKLCGGHGSCSCGKCYCENGYTGGACDEMSYVTDYNKGLGEGQENSCVLASSCEQCFEIDSSCGWYKHMDLPSGVESRCNLYDIHIMYGISAGDILTSQTTTNITTILEYQSDQCSERGSMNICGECVCNDDHYGKNCECDVSPGMTSEEVLSQCIRPNSTNGLICSGRGECICGLCNCLPLRPHSAQRYTGRYCQCDDYSCAYHNNQLCGGHGRCNCGECQCEPGFTGGACECPTSFETCLSVNGQICNGHGNCVCGRCACSGMFRGPTCEECPTCPGPCQTYKNCVFCKFNTGDYTQEECYTNCNNGNIQLVDVLDVGDNPGERRCSFTDSTDGFRVHFTYFYDDSNQIMIKVQKTKTAA